MNAREPLWGLAASDSLKEALNSAAKPFRMILGAYGLSGAGCTRTAAAADQAIRSVVLPMVVQAREVRLDAGELCRQKQMVAEIAGLASALADRLRNAVRDEREAFSLGTFHSPAADLLAGLEFDRLRPLDPASLIGDVDAIAASARALADADRETSRSRLPLPRKKTRQVTCDLARVWEAAKGEMPVSSSGAPRSRFVSLVQEWETAAGRAPGPAPNSIRAYLSKLAPRFPA